MCRLCSLMTISLPVPQVSSQLVYRTLAVVILLDGHRLLRAQDILRELVVAGEKLGPQTLNVTLRPGWKHRCDVAGLANQAKVLSVQLWATRPAAPPHRTSEENFPCLQDGVMPSNLPWLTWGRVKRLQEQCPA